MNWLLVGVGLVACVALLVLAAPRALRAFGRYLNEEANIAGLHPDGEKIKRELERGNPQPFERAMTEAEADWSKKFLTLRLLCGSRALAACRQWRDREPRNALAHLATGHAGIKAAWVARSARVADEVEEKDWEGFHGHLHAAETALRQAVALAPDDPTPWVTRITVAMGESNRAGVLECLREANLRDPGHVDAHRKALLAVSEKWLGSHAEALTVARTGAENVTQPHDIHGVVIYAHLLIHEYYSTFEESEERADEYLERASVRQECESALERCVGHPDHVERASSIQVLNDAAFFFYKVGDVKRTTELLLAIGERWTASPWDWGPGLTGRGSYQEVRKEMGLSP